MNITNENPILVGLVEPNSRPLAEEGGVSYRQVTRAHVQRPRTDIPDPNPGINPLETVTAIDSFLPTSVTAHCAGYGIGPSDDDTEQALPYHPGAKSSPNAENESLLDIPMDCLHTDHTSPIDYEEMSRMIIFADLQRRRQAKRSRFIDSDDDVPEAIPYTCCPNCPLCNTKPYCVNHNTEWGQCCTNDIDRLDGHALCDVCEGCNESCSLHFKCRCDLPRMLAPTACRNPIFPDTHHIALQLNGANGEWTGLDDHRDHRIFQENDAVKHRLNDSKGPLRKVLMVLHAYLVRHHKCPLRCEVLAFALNVRQKPYEAMRMFCDSHGLAIVQGTLRKGTRETAHDYIRRGATLMYDAGLLKQRPRTALQINNAICHAPLDMQKYFRAQCRLSQTKKRQNKSRQLNGSHGEWTEGDDMSSVENGKPVKDQRGKDNRKNAQGRGKRQTREPRGPRKEDQTNHRDKAKQQACTSTSATGAADKAEEVEKGTDEQVDDTPAIVVVEPKLAAALRAGFQGTELPDHTTDVLPHRIGRQQCDDKIFTYCTIDEAGDHVIPQNEINYIAEGNIGTALFQKNTYPQTDIRRNTVRAFLDDSIVDEATPLGITSFNWNLLLIPFLFLIASFFPSLLFTYLMLREAANHYWKSFNESLEDMWSGWWEKKPDSVAQRRSRLRFKMELLSWMPKYVCTLSIYLNGYGCSAVMLYIATRRWMLAKLEVYGHSRYHNDCALSIFTLLVISLLNFAFGCAMVLGTEHVLCESVGLQWPFDLMSLCIALYDIYHADEGFLDPLFDRRDWLRDVRLHHMRPPRIVDPRTMDLWMYGYWEWQASTTYVGKEYDEAVIDLLTDNRPMTAKSKPLAGHCPHRFVMMKRFRPGVLHTLNRIKQLREKEWIDMSWKEKLLYLIRWNPRKSDYDILDTERNLFQTRTISSMPYVYDAAALRTSTFIQSHDAYVQSLMATVRISMPIVNRCDTTIGNQELIAVHPSVRDVIKSAFQHVAKDAMWTSQSLNRDGPSNVPSRWPVTDPGTTL